LNVLGIPRPQVISNTHVHVILQGYAYKAGFAYCIEK
jgi:hypothetical protein